jgi:hypothetical protein
VGCELVEAARLDYARIQKAFDMAGVSEKLVGVEDYTEDFRCSGEHRAVRGSARADKAASAEGCRERV